MRFRLPVLLAGLALLPAISVSAALSGSIAVGPNINVSRLTGNQAETTVAVNPTNPNNVVIVSNVQFGNRLWEGYTLDGTNWVSTQIADGTDGFSPPSISPSVTERAASMM